MYFQFHLSFTYVNIYMANDIFYWFETLLRIYATQQHEKKLIYVQIDNVQMLWFLKNILFIDLINCWSFLIIIYNFLKYTFQAYWYYLILTGEDVCKIEKQIWIFYQNSDIFLKIFHFFWLLILKKKFEFFLLSVVVNAYSVKINVAKRKN